MGAIVILIAWRMVTIDAARPSASLEHSERIVKSAHKDTFKIKSNRKRAMHVPPDTTPISCPCRAISVRVAPKDDTGPKRVDPARLSVRVSAQPAGGPCSSDSPIPPSALYAPKGPTRIQGPPQVLSVSPAHPIPTIIQVNPAPHAPREKSPPRPKIAATPRVHT